MTTSAKMTNICQSRKHLESREVYKETAFLISIMSVLDEFITKFQREQPLSNLSHPNYEKLLKTTMARLMKIKVYTEKKGKAPKKVSVEDVNL